MKKSVFIISIVVIALILLNIPIFNRFTVSHGKTGKLVLIDTVDNAREFVVSFRHSVNRTPVNEFIRIQGSKLIVYKTTFYSYGAGMPEYDPGNGEKVSIKNGLVQIDNMNREFDSFTYIAGTYADHVLSYKDKSIKLSTLVQQQNPAFFKVKRISAFELIKYKLGRI